MTTINNVYLGDVQAEKIYLGSDLVWKREQTTQNSNSLVFSTQNYKSETKELPLSIIISGSTGLWQLKESGNLVADSSGFRVTGLTVEVLEDVYLPGTNSRNALSINLSRDGKNKNYNFSGLASYIALKYINSSNGSANGSVTITSFLGEDALNIFTLPNIELLVPSSLPESMTSLAYMFDNCNLFNQDIGIWNTSNIVSLEGTFRNASNFNKPIGQWNTSNVITFAFFLLKATNFNQDLSELDVSKVETFVSAFFECNKFNQPMSTWDTSSAITMNRMFFGCNSFNQNLSQWCVRNITSPPDLFSDNTSSWVLPKPVWGSCPRSEDNA